MSVQRILARLRPYSCFRSRQNTEVEFPMQLALPTSQLVDPRNNLRPRPRISTCWLRTAMNV